jgi:uncharacterized protein YkwD
LAAVLAATGASAAAAAAAAQQGRADADGVPPATAPPAPPAEITNPETIEPAIAAAVNSLRRRHRLRPLRIAAPLARAGDAHARALALAGLFTHDWPGGRPFRRWMPDFYGQAGYRRWSAGENLLWSTGTLTPQAAVSLWLGSPAHRRLLLTPFWREIGVGVVHAAGATGAYGGLDVYVVAAEFGART